STRLRDRLLGEIESIQSADEAASWAHRSLPHKNTLTVVDAQLVEAGFGSKLTALDGADLLEEAQSPHEQEPAFPIPQAEAVGAALPTSAGRARVAVKTIRLRDEEHRKFVATQPCMVCGRTPADAHHLRFAQPRAATNSPFRFVACITASCTATVTRSRGGTGSISILSPSRSSCGSTHIRSSRFVEFSNPNKQSDAAQDRKQQDPDKDSPHECSTAITARLANAGRTRANHLQKLSQSSEFNHLFGR
ncbi:MAG: hypothetical protein WA615_17740, partial [Bradyrhizobium sp.]